MCVYNTPMNTVGVGDPVPFGVSSLGSGDRFDTPITSKKAYKQYKPYYKKPASMPFSYTKPLPLLVMSKSKPKINAIKHNKKK